MLNRLIFLGIAMLSILVFQNCAQNPGTTVGESSQSKPSLSAKTFIFQDDYDRIGGAGLGNLSLDVQTGMIEFAASNSSSGVHAALSPSATKYCLDEEERSELEALLIQDKVCSQKRQDPDIVCTAIYRPAYAQYGSQTQSLVSVGEAVSGCSVVADFCSGNGDRIRQIIEIVKASLDSRICSSEY